MKSYEKTALTIWFFKGVFLISKFLSIPILLSILKIEEYAALVILLSLESWFLLFDCGIGASVQNFLSESFDLKEKSAHLKTALVFGLIVLGLISFLFFLFSSSLHGLFLGNCGLKHPHPIFLLAGSFLLLGAFGSIGGRIYLAENKTFLFYASQGASSLISLGALFLFQKNVGLKEAIFFAIGVPSLVSFCLTLHLFKKVNWDAPLDYKVLKRAAKFAFFALMAAGVLSVDAFMIPHLLKAEEIVQYHIITKLFAPITFSYSAWLQGFWPTCTAFWALDQKKEIQERIVKYSLIGVVCVSLFTVGFLCTSNFIGSLLKVSLPFLGVIWAGIYFSSRVISDFHAMALQSRSDLKPFFYLVPVQALMSASFQWFFTVRFGMTGIFIGLTLSYLLTVCWALPLRLHKIKHKAYV